MTYYFVCDHCYKECSIEGFAEKEGAIIHCPYCGQIKEIEEDNHDTDASKQE